MANVMGPWKAHHWPYINIPEARNRLFLSIVILNVLPITFFGIAVWSLAGPPVPSWSLPHVLGVVFYGVIPAYADFAFYRLWLGWVESNPKAFYRKNNDGSYITEDSSKSTVDLTPEASRGNLISGLVYFIAAAVPLIVRGCN